MTSSNVRTLIALIATTALATVASCNGGPAPTTSGKRTAPTDSSTGNESGSARARHTPAAMTVHAQVVHGTLQAQIRDQPWQVLAAGESLAGVSAIRSLGRGALVDLTHDSDSDSPAAGPTMWLRAGTSVSLWRDLELSNNRLLIELTSGQARIRAHAERTYIAQKRGARDITGRDIVAYRRVRDAEVAFVYTERAPERALFSIDIESADENGTLGAGLGSIEVRPNADDQTSYLELRRVDVKVAQAGDYAFTEVEHVFYNPTDERLEGTFRFPLPAGAAPLGLAMEINGRLMEGEIVARDKARKTYESIVDEMQDPALLEWQQGNRFKLRVFPIEPNSEKRVVLRYAGPLAETIRGFEYVYSTAAPSMQKNLESFRLRFDGRTLVDRQDFAAGEDIIVPLPAEAVPQAAVQVIPAPADAPESPGADWSQADSEAASVAAIQARTAGTYLALRIQPDWDELTTGEASAADPGAATTMLAIVDTSRSALESRELGLQNLQMVLEQLDRDDRFLVMTADIAANLVTAKPQSPDAASITAAVAAVRAIEPDGASDIGLAFARSAEVLAPFKGAGRSLEILYIGDGTPTWGITEPGELKTRIDRALASIPVHAAILGKGASRKTWGQLMVGRAGRMASPRTLADARRFAFLASHSHATPRIDDLQIAEIAGANVFPNQPQPLYRGDSLVAVIRAPAPGADKEPLSAVELTGTYAGRPFKQTVRIIAPKSSDLVAKRWASKQIDQLQKDKADKHTIIALSKDFGVMSKHTSLLVLESEEAYKQHGIERRRAREQLLAQNRPQVTGGDLESLGGRSPSLSPDHIQPGDPEIRIPAPRDARSVVVIFPFGDTKLAHFDSDADAWIARFLIDKDTPDGKYMVIVNVTHADGRLQTYRLPYFVDTSAPQVTLNFRPRGKGFIVSAKQKITSAEMVAMGIDQGTAQNGPNLAKQAKFLSDAKRVELYLPDGNILSLSRKGPGKFRRRWRLADRPTEAMAVRVVVTDEAHNQSSFTVRVTPDGAHEIMTATDDAAPQSSDAK